MPAIKMRLRDVGTSGKQTDIWSEESCLVVRYVSFDVWKDLFDFRNGRWFAISEAEVSETDTDYGFEIRKNTYEECTILIQLVPEAVDRILGAKLKYDQQVDFLPPEIDFIPLFSLNGELSHYLDIESPEKFWQMESPKIQTILVVKEDFILDVTPVPKDRIKHVLLQILRVHQGYAGIDLSVERENEILAQLESEFRQKTNIRIKTCGKRLRITQHSNSSIKYLLSLFGIWGDVTWIPLSD